jgi:pimeloyl-ACP methyl ester carboxylesterase
VQPAGRITESVAPKVPVDRVMQQARRLDQGFKLLLRLDVRADVARFAGPLLSVYGQHSQLVRGINVELDQGALQLRLEIPGGGMRPLLDAPDKVRQALHEHLGIGIGELA